MILKPGIVSNTEMILKSGNKRGQVLCGWFWAAVRQLVFFGFEVWDEGNRRRSGGTVGISPVLRDFQGLVGRKGNPASGFPGFPPARHFHRSRSKCLDGVKSFV
jgi:hypothetical protein